MNKLKGFLQIILQDFMKKKICTWNIRHLVNELFVPSAQRTSELRCRLSDFRIMYLRPAGSKMGNILIRQIDWRSQKNRAVQWEDTWGLHFIDF